MRSFLKPAAGLTCLFALATAGCSAESDDSSDAAAGAPQQSSASPSEASAIGRVDHVVRPVRQRHGPPSDNDSRGLPRRRTTWPS